MRARQILKEMKVELTNCGHTSELHVVSHKALKNRMFEQNELARKYQDITGLGLTSTFNSALSAKMAIKNTLLNSKFRVDEWLDFRVDNKLAIEVQFSFAVGYGIAMNTDFNTKYEMHKCIVVLQLGEGSDFFDIVTAYPAPSDGVRKQIIADQTSYLQNKRR